MKLTYPGLEAVIDTVSSTVNTIVIENQKLLFDFLTDITSQVDGATGDAVLSVNDRLIDISKNLEIIDSFISFDINRKSLISKIAARLESNALDEAYYTETLDVLGSVEKLLDEISFDFPGEISFSKITAATLIKAATPVIVDDYDSVSEKLIDYMELVTEFDRSKLFILVNMRSFVQDKEIQSFIDTVLSHQLNVVMIENKEYNHCTNENRIIIDSDLCEI